MKTILVTGSDGFIGRNLCVALRRERQFEVLEFDLRHPLEELPALTARADFVFHLAGINRPSDPGQFDDNPAFTRRLCGYLAAASRPVPLMLSSSIQAELDNPYGRSKLQAEDAVREYHGQTQAPVYIYRLPNVFGKWSRPNYNTVVATFCYNISHGLPVQISNRAQLLRFVYVDDVVHSCLKLAARHDHAAAAVRSEIHPVYSTTLGELHDLLQSFRAARQTAVLPDLSNPFIKSLYSTYVSFYETSDFAYPVDFKTDERGWLFELVKSGSAGQIFVSRTRPGITRANHYHDSKVEKFCVIQGEGVIRFRHLLGQEIIEYPVNGQDIRVVDIPPGYTHSLENTGTGDLLTLFWASEIFDPEKPDTYFLKVQE